MKIYCKWRLALSSFMYAWNSFSNGWSTGKSVIVVLTKYHTKTACQHKFLELLSAYVFRSLKAGGNVMSEAFYEKGDLCTIWVIERWSSYVWYKKNKESGEAGVISALTKTGLEFTVETIFLKDLLLFSNGSSLEPKINDRQITIMLFVDLKSGTEDYFRSVSQGLMPIFRGSPGVLLFQLSQVIYMKTRFIVCKKFRDWDAFRYHLKDPALQPMITFLQHAVKEPPYEKGYRYLVQFAPLYGDFRG